ncbi:MAG: hypothetical protein IJC84_02820 [Clostridia bacterium]|nr:hypothetical protein [Clostridia bacterium]
MKQKLKAILLYAGIPILVIALCAISYFVVDNFAYANFADFPWIVSFLLFLSAFLYFYLHSTFSAVFSALYFAAILKKEFFEKEPLQRRKTLAISVSVVLLMNLLYSIFLGIGSHSASRGVLTFFASVLLSCGICFLILFYRYRVWRWERGTEEPSNLRWERKMAELSSFQWLPILRGVLFVLCSLLSLVMGNVFSMSFRYFLIIYAMIIGATLKREKKAVSVLLFWTVFTGAVLFLSMALTYSLLESFGPPIIDYIIEAVFSFVWCPLGYLCAAHKSKKKKKAIPTKPTP